MANDSCYIFEDVYAQLRNFDLEMIRAFNGQDSLESIKETQPDLVLMYLYMPILDGIEASLRIKVT